MPNVKSAKKRVKTNLRDTIRNRHARTTMRTALKKAIAALESGDGEVAKTAVQRALSQVGRCAKKGIIHANTAARQQSRLMRRMNGLKPSAE